MKETTKSLKIYLLIVGIYGIYAGLKNMGVDFKLDIVLGLSHVVNIAIGLVTLYISWQFDKLLSTNANALIKFFYFEAVYPFVISFYFLRFSAETFGVSLIFNLIGLAIISYIIKNVKRLAKERTMPVVMPQP